MANYKIGVIGLWHLGEIYAAGLASLGHSVAGISEDEKVIADLNRGIPPLPEPHLAELIKESGQAGRLSFTTDVAAVKDCNVVWFTFDTPVNDKDESDLAPIRGMLKKTIPHLANDVLIVLSSQLPVGTSRSIEASIKKARPSLKFHLVYSPENLRLGDAVNCFLKPERVVVGAADEEGAKRMEDIFRKTGAQIVKMSPASAEMAKHALNSFLATSISFINDIADACDEAGADVLDVIKALRSDPRIGERAALNAGLGFSGGTLGRDLISLSRFAKAHGAKLPVIEHVFAKNASRPEMLVARLSRALGGLKGKRIALYGLTYKPGTTTLRRSRSLEVAALLTKKGALLSLSDPHVPLEDIPRIKGATAIQDPVMAAKGAQALVFLTPWPDFKDLDFAALAKQARTRAVLLDSANFLAPKEPLIKQSGFRYYGIGR